MSDKPEVYLEIGAGFFRIPTTEANYNITVLGSGESSVTRVVEKIVETEKEDGGVAVGDAMSAVSEGLAASGDDGFYRDVSNEIYQDIGNLAKSLSATIMDIPAEDRQSKRAELDEAGDKIEDAKKQLKDIVNMTEKAAMEIMDNVENVQGRTNNARELLSTLKNHAAFAIPEEGDAGDEGGSMAEEAEALQEQMKEAMDLLAAIQEEPVEAAAPEPSAPEVKKEKKTRFLFDLDVVFQTLYELCTNETVKDHISTAREKAGEIFVLDTFYDAIAPKAAEYEADSDNFFTVPMSDVFTSLGKACKDKGIGNLLKKMDAGQSSIFLDQTIPLEVPPTEEVEVETEVEAEAAPESAPETAEPDPRIDQARELLAKALEAAEALPAKAGQGNCAGRSTMTLEDQKEIFEKIEDAFGIASTISDDVTKITEALSFQDLSGQQIMKIIKLLSDFQVQLLALVVSFGSQLKHKKENASITVEESKKLAQGDVDSYINKLSGGTDEEGGVLDQQTVNQMLEDMGF